MTYINWDKPFAFELGSETLYIPTYGNYGGPNYSSGTFGRDPPLNQDGSYLSNRELDNNKDALDYLFYRHDVASSLADTPKEERAADLALIRRIGGLSDKQMADPEARLYAGAATIGIGAEILVEHPRKSLAEELQPYMEDAVDNILTGLSQLNPVEFTEATLLLSDVVDDLQDIDFKGRAVDKIFDDLDSYIGDHFLAFA